MSAGRGAPPQEESFRELTASILFCGTCHAPQPVRERLLLVLPDGELREYLCAACGASVGSRRVSGAQPILIASEGRQTQGAGG
jgi:hypothetical protein